MLSVKLFPIGIYETPGGEILLAAHLDLEVFTLDRVSFH